jgi:predicted DsbA family dithiol-disulfide isomerase
VIVMAEIEVFADACCPFAHVGLRRIREACDAAGRSDLVLHVRAWPLDLVNGTPLDGAFIDEECDDIREQVAPDLFSGFVVGSFPGSSIPAMAAAARAYAVSPEAGQAVSLAVRDALFEHGRPIGDHAVLVEIAGVHGVDLPEDPVGDEALVRAEWEDGRARGVIGSPHFFVHGENVFCPVLDIERVDGHLRIRIDEAALETFLARAMS